MAEMRWARGISYEGKWFSYVVDSPDGNTVITKEGFVAMYDPISTEHWIQWSDGKLVHENLYQLMKAHPSLVFQQPPDTFVPTAATCELLDANPVKKRVAAEKAQAKPAFKADYEPNLFEEVAEEDMPRPRRRRTGSNVPDSININVPINITVPSGMEHLLKCPITLQVFRDPVMAEDGHTYERTAIERWLRRNQTSPMTTEPMGLNLLSNRSLKSVIAESRAATNE